MQQEFLKWVGNPDMSNWLLDILSKVESGQVTQIEHIPSPLHTDQNNTIFNQRKTLIGLPKRSIKPHLSRSIIKDKREFHDVSNIKNSTKKNSINGLMKNEELNEMTPKQLTWNIFLDYIDEKEVEIDYFFGINSGNDRFPQSKNKISFD